MTTPNASEMLIHISNNIPQLISLATALAYIGGTYMIITAIAAMRHAPFLSSPQQEQQSMWPLMRKVFVGSALIYLPSIVHIGTYTFFNDTSPIIYFEVSHIEIFSDLFIFAKYVLYLIGTIAIIKGLYGLSEGDNAKSEDGSQLSITKKGVIRIIAGVFCMNIGLVIQIIFITLGLS